ncbi:MAG: LuxR C-terminal-related transcriptional regulator [Planctomycetota bacterium]|jgi:DNA-binding NarL/FixJ family response regulator
MVPRVVCVDGSALCLLGVQQACEDARLEWKGGVQSIHQIEPILESQPIDIVISEVRVGKKDLLDYWHERSLAESKTKLIVHTYDENPTHIARASACRAWDYIAKRQPIQRLIQACHSAIHSNRLPDSVMLNAEQFLGSSPSYNGTEAAVLTKRERQILAHLALGLSNREISSSIAISMETVKEHVQNVLRKLKTKDRTAAAVWAIRNGLPHFTNSDPVAVDGVAQSVHRTPDDGRPIDQ